MGDKSAVKQNDLKVSYNPSWFLKDLPVRASYFQYLINGEQAFNKLYEEIEQAKISVDIAIWGFQPSMFFKRDGKSLCIGDLLAKKALEGVKVRVLIWSMEPIYGIRPQTGKLDTTNMGNSKYSRFKGVEGETQEQKQYDLLWYYATNLDQYGSVERGSENKLKHQLDTNPKYRLLNQLKDHPVHAANLVVHTRSVDLQAERYLDRELSIEHVGALKAAASHHQKTVLIDYEMPKIARGFILEHNMLDNYWSTDKHPVKQTEPNLGKNVPTPLQDTSSFIRGPNLFDINTNFFQAWNKVAKKNEKIPDTRNKITAQQFPAVSPVVAMQVLRTYDEPQLEQIKLLYLQNIKKTTSYIYTENQYFRWPPLVEEFKKHWEAMKKSGQRVEPIHWFVVTNSSDAGLGDGTVNTDRMFKALGRRDVMPQVALKQIRKYQLMPEQSKNLTDNKSIAQEMKKYDPAKNNEILKDSTIGMKDKEVLANLKKELSDTIGIKCHICVLHSMESNAKNWQEIYIHSKVTMIDDVFLTMGSANINTRSMQVDTEMNLALENAATVKKFRKELWALNTRSTEANPPNMHLNSTAKMAFEKWQKIIDQNEKLKKDQNDKPQQPLSEFLRLSAKISNLD